MNIPLLVLQIYIPLFFALSPQTVCYTVCYCHVPVNEVSSDWLAAILPVT